MSVIQAGNGTILCQLAGIGKVRKDAMANPEKRQRIIQSRHGVP